MNPTEPEIAAYAAATIIQELLVTLIEANVLSRRQVAELLDRAAQRHDAVASMGGAHFVINSAVSAAIMRLAPSPDPE